MRFLKSQILILTLFLVFQANAQEKPVCKVGGIDFACPDRIEVLTNDGAKDLFVGFNSKASVYVYAFSPDKESSKDDLIKNALEKTFEKVFLTKFSDYKVKDSDDFRGKSTWSKYETDKFAKAGFNNDRNHLVHFQYVILYFEKKQIVAGFLYERDSKLSSEQAFSEWRGGGNGNASFDLQNLITSITGEKRMGETPGGPPPPAPPSRKQ